MAADAAETESVGQVTMSATVTRENSGTAWLRLREGGRYFDVAIAGDWQGRVTLEVRPPGDGSAAATRTLETFQANTGELLCLDQDLEVRLWVREGDFHGGRVKLEIGT